MIKEKRNCISHEHRVCAQILEMQLPLILKSWNACLCSIQVRVCFGWIFHTIHTVFSVVSPPPRCVCVCVCACVCVFNKMTLFLREGLTRSGRYGSSTSPAGLTTVCPITPQACWDLLGESSPRPWTMLGPWWFTAGQQAWADRSYIYAAFPLLAGFQWLCPAECICSPLVMFIALLYIF